MKLDVIILADYLENMRDNCIQYYQIDPCYCYSAPGLSWDAGLKIFRDKIKIL